MKTLIFMSFLLLPAPGRADTFLMKDGARLEGEVTGEMDGAVLVKTRYGALTLNKADIQERKAAEPAPALPVPASTGTTVAASTAAAVEVSTVQPAAAEPAPGLTFFTVITSTASRQLVYSENGIAIATETYDAAGTLLSLEGAVRDGTYTEYYPDGGLKTVKSMLAGKGSGTLKAFYQGGSAQVEAYYMSGVKEGLLRYFAEDGKLLMEAEYRGDKLNGWKKEYGPDGLPQSQAYYVDDVPAEAPKAQAAPEPAGETDSMVTVKRMSLARGERFSFQFNGKYVGKAHLDKDLNIISQEGKVPDGSVKVYTRDGKLELEFIFARNAIQALRSYEPGGPLKAEYTYVENKAVKK